MRTQWVVSASSPVPADRGGTHFTTKVYPSSSTSHSSDRGVVSQDKHLSLSERDAISHVRMERATIVQSDLSTFLSVAFFSVSTVVLGWGSKIYSTRPNYFSGWKALCFYYSLSSGSPLSLADGRLTLYIPASGIDADSYSVGSFPLFLFWNYFFSSFEVLLITVGSAPELEVFNAAASSHPDHFRAIVQFASYVESGVLFLKVNPSAQANEANARKGTIHAIIRAMQHKSIVSLATGSLPLLRILPIAADSSPSSMVIVLRRQKRAVRAGSFIVLRHLLCQIFPTRTPLNYFHLVHVH